MFSSGPVWLALRNTEHWRARLKRQVLSLRRPRSTNARKFTSSATRLCIPGVKWQKFRESTIKFASEIKSEHKWSDDDLPILCQPSERKQSCALQFQCFN
uniref:Uncharacterized protein n=1 Tax=Globisporangium ultimum (strain ATCC 200006 / CBS 805.95 / DAOM BR144) TaxID=431595 RepID=K3XA76_GLOUD